ncbi:MAG: isoprenylcysteine carboxylmethyltransferase family protein [candidate division Zixibacteria bacterium]|nr:isoprenylcysteine carboxylmethyltransferase family protein [candidate division Zixibacteria bacterium]
MSFTIKIVVFIVATIGLAWVSWPSLRHIRSHGFYRFLTWESILVLFLLNLNQWFYNPFSPYQIISWFLLLVSLFMVVYGAQALRVLGKSTSDRKDPSLRGIEKTTELVTVGAYRYVRHPIYSSLLSGAWGIFFKQPSIDCFCLAAITTFLLTKTAKVEEAENIRFFGEAYRNYMKRTRMFIPYIF